MAENDVTLALIEYESLFSKDEVALGTAAGDYIVTHAVASGGCSSVYRARHRSSGHEAAIKVLHASLAVKPKMIERFAREVQMVNLLRHPNIIEIYDIGELPDGRPYYAMEYVSGGTLAEFLAERGRLAAGEVLELLESVCAALDAAHAAGVIHRDVKGSNIIIKDGELSAAKLVDFGIAKLLSPHAQPIGLTSEGRNIGTLTIMAPEQLLGGPVGPHTDVYALGVLLYRLFTGIRPFDGRSVVTLARQHLEQPAPRPSERAQLSSALDAIVLRCLEKKPEHRYASVKALVGALRREIRGVGCQSIEAPMSVAGVAVYVEIRLRTEADQVDEAMSDDIGTILDIAEETLEAAGFLLALSTGSQVLGIRLLPLSAESARECREEAVAVAASVRGKLDGRVGAHHLIHVNVCMHAGEVVVRPTQPPEVIGGALARAAQWAPSQDVAELCGTRELLGGLSDLACLAWTPGPGALMRIAPQARRSGP
jgi:eukaryotic-like serine/threonine-protein kinase